MQLWCGFCADFMVIGCQGDRVTGWVAVGVWVLCGFHGDRVSWCQGDRVTGRQSDSGRVMRLWCGFCAGFMVIGCHGVRVAR